MAFRYKYVICERIEREDSLTTRLLASGFYKLIRLFVIPDYPAKGFDLALMDGDMLPHLRDSGKNIDLSLFGYWLGFQPEVIYYKRQKRRYGKSRWTFHKKLNLFINSLLGFSILPIRFTSLIGLLFSVVSFGYGILVVTLAILGRRDMPGFATLVALLTFLLGLIIVMLGMIGEYVWRIFDEVTSRPEAIIDEIY